MEEHADGNTTLIQGDFMESQVLGNEIRKKQLHYLARKLNIPVHHFWHPDMAEREAEAKQLSFEVPVRRIKKQSSTEGPK